MSQGLDWKEVFNKFAPEAFLIKEEEDLKQQIETLKQTIVDAQKQIAAKSREIAGIQGTREKRHQELATFCADFVKRPPTIPEEETKDGK